MVKKMWLELLDRSNVSGRGVVVGRLSVCFALFRVGLYSSVCGKWKLKRIRLSSFRIISLFYIKYVFRDTYFDLWIICRADLTAVLVQKVYQ